MGSVLPYPLILPEFGNIEITGILDSRVLQLQRLSYIGDIVSMSTGCLTVLVDTRTSGVVC